MQIYDYYMGVDPGKNGAIIVLNPKGEVIFNLKTPETIQDFINALLQYKETNIYCYIEYVHSQPINGAKANFSFGKTIGILESVLTISKIPFEQVTPQCWMKSYGMKREKTESKNDWKKRLKEKSQQLFPDVRVTLDNADALLIAEYCRRKFIQNS